MRYRDMARRYLLEAQIRAAQSADARVGRDLEVGRDLTPAELRQFTYALGVEVRARVAAAEAGGIIESGTILPPGLAA